MLELINFTCANIVAMMRGKYFDRNQPIFQNIVVLDSYLIRQRYSYFFINATPKLPSHDRPPLFHQPDSRFPGRRVLICYRHPESIDLQPSFRTIRHLHEWAPVLVEWRPQELTQFGGS